jgi:hypothetical protein
MLVLFWFLRLLRGCLLKINGEEDFDEHLLCDFGSRYKIHSHSESCRSLRKVFFLSF